MRRWFRQAIVRAACATAIVAGLAASASSGGQVDPGDDVSPGSWTLERCLTEALSSSHELRGSAARVAAARARAETAQAARWPTIGFTGGFRHVSEVMSLEIPMPGGVPPRRIQYGDGRAYELGLGARAHLFRGGELANRARAEEAAARAALYELAADSLGVTRELRRAYFAALGAAAQENAARLAVQRIQRHLDELTYMIEVGAAAEEARIQTMARMRVAEQASLRARGERESACLELGRLVGRPGESVIPEGELPQSLVAGTGLAPSDIEARPELAALAERTEESRWLAQAARGGFWPSITAEGIFHYDRPGIDPVTNDWMDYRTLGLGLEWTLWDRGARARRVEEATATASLLSEERLNLRSVLQSARETARVRLHIAREELAKAQERVELEERRLELVNGRYREALAAESELLDAQDDLAEAEADLANAMARLRLAEVEYLHLASR